MSSRSARRRNRELTGPAHDADDPGTAKLGQLTISARFAYLGGLGMPPIERSGAPPDRPVNRFIRDNPWT